MADTPAEEQFLREYEGEHAQELAEWLSIGNDLIHVMEAAKKLIELMDAKNEDATLQRALWSSAVVAYVRCFSTGRRVSLDPSVYKELEGDPLAPHQFYVDARNKHVAHPVNVFEETKIGLLVGSKGEVRGVGNLSVFRIADDRQGVWRLGQLANRAHKFVSAKLEESQSKVLESAKRSSPETLLKLPELHIKPQDGTDAAKKNRPYAKPSD